MLEKKANIDYKMPIEALHVPTQGAWAFYNTSRIKVASLDKAKQPDLNGFDIKAAIEKNPDNLFVKVFAIKANEVNDNGDCFSETELKKAAHTFIGVPVFVNHQNDNIENARGKVIHAWYDDSVKGIYCINMVDRAAYPRLARGIEEKYVTGCFPPDAPVLMSDGTEKPICDIEDGDYVISGKGNICKVLGKRQRGYDYPLYSIDIEGIKNPLVCTSHHNIFVYRLPKDCACGCGMALSKCEDKRITEKNFNKIFRQGHNPRGIKLKHEYIQKIRACDIEEGDFLIEPKFLKESFDEITEDEAFLIGLFVAEGSFEKRNGVRHSVIFNFSHKELETLAFRCSELLEKVFSNNENKPTTNYYPGSSQTRVCLYGKSVADWFYKYCGEYSDQKKIHKDLLSLDKNKTAALLAGYMEGDGYNVKGKVYGCATVSKDLASQLRLLFAKIGVRTRFRKKEVKTGYKAKAGGGYTQAYEIEFGLTTCGILRDKLIYKKAKEECHNQAKFHSLDDITIRKIKSIKEVEYDGIVYDIEVEGDHSYCVNHLSVSNTSMGAQVSYSICSICHNKAHTADEFCTHIKNGKNRKVSGKYECKYHESPCKPEDDCPLDGNKKGKSHEMIHKEAKIYEWNYDIKFIEDSFVVNPACHDCLVCDILNMDAVKNVTSNKFEELKKVASSLKESVDKMEDGSLQKTAGKTELQALTQAMNLMDHVARSMLAQKQQIQLDYVSDLVEQLAKVKSLTDELTEMGYSQLPSPTDHEIAFGNMMKAPTGTDSQQIMNPSQVGQNAQQGQQPQQPAPQPQRNTQPQTEASPASSSLGDIGSVTRPSFVGASEEIKKDFLKQAENMNNKLESVSSVLRGSVVLLAQRRDELSSSEQVFEFVNGNIKVTVANVEGNGLVVGKWKDDKLVSWSSVDELGDELKELFASNPKEAAKLISNQNQKESGVNMSLNQTTKVAAGDNSQQETITQNQLNDVRADKAPEVITQAQLDGKGGLKPLNDTTSDGPNTRTDKAPEVITQAQLDSIPDGDLARWDSYPEVITQAQWDEMSRRASNTLGSDYTESITQAQLESLQKSHKWTAPETITQDQLNNQKKVSPEGKSASQRWASSAKDLVKAASSAVADAIANYGLTPMDISNAVNQISASPFSSIKASYLTLVNATPKKVEARLAEINRKNYFAKIANVNSVSPIDGLLASMGDNIGYLQADDFVDAIKFVVNNKKAFASAEQNAHVKMASSNSNKVEVVNKEDAFLSAFAEMDRPEDGLYKICGTLSEDVTVHPSNQSEFMKALYSFAKSHISVPFVIAEVKVDEENETFEVDCKEQDKCDKEEKEAFTRALNSQFKVAEVENKAQVKSEPSKTTNKVARSSNRANLIKEAQMMGGQMGGGMGAGGPAGGTGTMGGADMNAGGVPPAENLGGQPGDLGSEGEDAMGSSEESDLQPKPPGTICPVCGSSDVDILDGKGKCGNCSAEFTYKVQLEITKYPGLIDGEEGKDKGEDQGGEGFALPEEGAEAPASLPVAAMTRINANMIKKASEDAKARGSSWSLGSISPYTGSDSVIKLDNNKFLCLDTGSTYSVKAAGVEKNNKKAVFAEWTFDAKPLNRDCESCRRKKASFLSALKSHGITEEVFDSMLLEEKGKTILAMKEKGLIKNVKLASSESLVNGLKKVASFGSKFPIETCRAKIASKYGENALALSGPCEGKNLADCVCKKLSTAGVYANDIAVKIASIWANEDQMVECVEDYVRTKSFNMKQACVICDQLKNKFAQFEDHVADELSEMPSDDGSDPSGGTDDKLPENESDDFGSDDMDPFSSDAEMPGNTGGQETSVNSLPESSSKGTLTVELPLEVLEQFDLALDKAKGENPLEEKHHQAPLSGETIIEIPGPVADGVDEIADQVLDKAVEVTEDANNMIDSVMKTEEPASESTPESMPSSENTEENSEKEVSEESSFEESTDENLDEESSEEENSEENSEEKEDNSPEVLNKTGDEEESSSEESNKDRELMSKANSNMNHFKKSRISATGEINLDLTGVLKVLSNGNKSLKEAKNVVIDQVQDNKDIGKYQDNSVMGNEEKFDAKKPEVFTGKATMGGEKDAGLEPVKDLPKFESGGAEMGDEKAQGYTAEKQNAATGGDKGSGNILASSKSRVSDLAQRIAKASNEASEAKALSESKLKEKKLETAKPMSEDKDLNSSKGNMKKKDFGKIDNGDASFMGHEKETLKSVPKADKDAPSIPVGGGKNSKYDKNEDNAPEKQTSIEGTVIASGNVESLAVKKEAATRVAGRKLKAGMISIDKLASEIEKLSRYEASDLKDLETALFGTSKKGLDTVAQGSEKPLVVSEKSNQRNAGLELKDSIQNLFSLNRSNNLAQEDPNTELKKSNYRS